LRPLTRDFHHNDLISSFVIFFVRHKNYKCALIKAKVLLLQENQRGNILKASRDADRRVKNMKKARKMSSILIHPC
jgi:hypothetical protein